MVKNRLDKTSESDRITYRKETEMRDIYAELTDKVIAGLEAGVRPWFKPWASTWADRAISRPLRANGKPYRGINVINLWITAELKGYSNPYWMTFKQAKELGGHVRKGEQATFVVLSKRITVEKGTEDEHEVPFLTGFPVFNCDQIDDLPEKYHPKTTRIERPANAPIPTAEAFFANLGVDLRHGGDRAYYSPSKDFVQLPKFEDFNSAEDYYCTRGHETVHWTGHKDRMDRNFDQKRWGDEGYAVEELVAELGSVFLAADLGISAQPRADHADYMAHWLKVLKADKRAIFTAASHAEKAVTYLHEKQPGYVAPIEEAVERPAKAKRKGKAKARAKTKRR